jgi:hypothetical protein
MHHVGIAGLYNIMIAVVLPIGDTCHVRILDQFTVEKVSGQEKEIDSYLHAHLAIL